MSQQTRTRPGDNEITGPLVLHVSVGDKILPIDIYTAGYVYGDPDAGVIAWTPHIGLTIADIAPHAMFEDKHCYLGPPSFIVDDDDEEDYRHTSFMSFVLCNSYGQALDMWIKEARLRLNIWEKQGKYRQWARKG